MSNLECEVGQVIVVVETPSGSDAKTEKISSEVAPIQRVTSEKSKRKLIKWEILEKLPSTAAFNQWLKKKAAAGMKYVRKKTSSSAQGAVDFYGCTGSGCLVQLQVLFLNSSEDVIISYNEKQHTHVQKPHTGWGLPDKTKMEVQRLFHAGVTSITEVDARLRKDGHSEYTLKQLVGFLGRVKRQSRAKDIYKEYTELSVWNGGDRSSAGESRVTEEPEQRSPSPAENQDVEFSDASAPASLLRESTTAHRRDTSRPRRPQPDMDEGTVRRLVDASLAARAHSYSPYSQFPVGAALLCPDGQIVSGCNVENASFGLTNCAERTAVFKAVSEGRKQFTAVAIAAEMGDKFVGPCGACRQVLAEFNAEMPVILAKPNGDISRTSMKELLPMAFLPEEVTFKKA